EVPDTAVILENGIAIEVDVKGGQKTGYFYDQRENRASIAPLMRGWGAKSGIRLELRDAGELPESMRDAALAAAGGSAGAPAGAEASSNGEERALVPVNANGKIVTFPYWDGATVLE